MFAQRPTPAARIPELTLRGIVVDSSSGGALPRARITVMPGRATGATVVAGADGTFSVGVPAGTPLSLRIVKAGYASMTLPVSPQQIAGTEPLRIDVPRGAVIAGRAVDASGEPAQRVVIRRLPSGNTTWSPAGPDGAVWNVVSMPPDDRGEFRVGGLVAGRYVIDAYPEGTGMTINRLGEVQIVASPSQPASATVDVQAGSEATVDVTLERRPAGSLPADPVSDLPGRTIRGTVTSTAGAPVANATVTAGGPMSGRNASTDEFGRFTLRGISPGRVMVRAFKRGYVSSEPGERGGALPVQPVIVEPDRDRDNLSIVLPRSGVIGGTVIDEQGEPIEDTGVQLIRVRRQPTGALVATREPGFMAQRSDDRGQFRLSGIVPGDYVVMASLPMETVDPSPAVRTAYLPAYYPDTSDFANASPIRIADGENIAGLILTMRRVPVARVSGVARTSQGLPVAGTVRLMSRHAASLGPDTRVVSPGPDGAFTFADVPPGDYLLRTMVESGPSGPEFAMSAVTVVDRDPEPLAIRTSRGSTLNGTIVLEGSAGAVLWGYSAGSAALDSVSSRGSATSVSSVVSSGESFTLSGLAGPTRLRVWSDDRNWYVKSILIDGFDVTDAPFDLGSDARLYSGVDVTFARAATITGRVTDERAAPVRDYAVYVFTTDRDKWFEGSRWVKLARASADGTFTASSLPPGDYWVAAIDRVDTSTPRFSDGSLAPAAADWVDAELLTQLASRATRTTLGEGQPQTVTLRLVPR
jgi:protocatechuate 3,4-dioxygenase beta subunit